MIPIRERMARKNKPSAAERREGNSKKHLEFIRQLPCCVTGAPPRNDPHHLKEGLSHERGLGRRSTDRWAVPLSRAKHDELERLSGKQEWSWFRRHGIDDPLELAAALYRVSGDLAKGRAVLAAHNWRLAP